MAWIINPFGDSIQVLNDEIVKFKTKRRNNS